MKFPTTRFVTPESAGAGRATSDLAINGSSKVVFPDLRQSTVSINGDLDSSHTVGLENRFGIFDSIDVEANIAANSPIDFGIKWQFWGQPEASAGAGNFSMAIRFAYGLYVTAGEVKHADIAGVSEDRDYTFESGHPNYEFLIGYRIGAPFLVYGGAYKGNYSITTTFVQGSKQQIRLTGKLTGIHLGVSYKIGVMNLKLSLGKFNNLLKPAGLEESGTSVGTAVGFLF